MPQTLVKGIYAGVMYYVLEKDGKKYIAIEPEFVVPFKQKGANLHLLDDIGDQDPDIVMEALFASMQESKESSADSTH